MSGVAHKPSDGADAFIAAHDALRADRAVQFDLRPAPTPDPPPQWLLDVLKAIGEALAPVGRFFAWITSFMPDAPFARILLWGVIAVVAGGIVWLVIRRVAEWRRFRRPSAHRTDDSAAAGDELLDALPMRQWLEEADLLAERAQYGKAVHHLLVRSVEDIAKRRPNLVRPSLTSRDLARADAVPERARGLFSEIAAVVERGLFGGKPVGPDDWQRCRAAYSDFAHRRAWSA